jgi:hypothetical protein
MRLPSFPFQNGGWTRGYCAWTQVLLCCRRCFCFFYDSWTTFGRHLDDSWTTFGRHLDDSWTTFGRVVLFGRRCFCSTAGAFVRPHVLLFCRRCFCFLVFYFSFYIFKLFHFVIVFMFSKFHVVIFSIFIVFSYLTQS